MTKSSKIQEIGGDETAFYHPVIWSDLQYIYLFLSKSWTRGCRSPVSKAYSLLQRTCNQYDDRMIRSFFHQHSPLFWLVFALDGKVLPHA